MKKRGGARVAITKCTPEMESALVDWVERKYYTFARSSCFSTLKARIKAYLALSHEEMMNVLYGQKTELRMQLLEKAAEHAMPCMDLRLVNKMARPCALSVAAAIRGEPMESGTLLWTKSTLEYKPKFKFIFF
ncbi:hypothetical protein PR002_g22739 [Phytophthora rubi]|nr:hypothetical protein PR002_g22739 [Phytophthora rubi]